MSPMNNWTFFVWAWDIPNNEVFVIEIEIYALNYWTPQFSSNNLPIVNKVGFTVFVSFA